MFDLYKFIISKTSNENPGVSGSEIGNLEDLEGEDRETGKKRTRSMRLAATRAQRTRQAMKIT